MVHVDGECLNAICIQMKGNELFDRQRQIHLTNLRLDLHFPHAGNAEEQAILRILERLVEVYRKLLGLIEGPNEDLRVRSSFIRWSLLLIRRLLLLHRKDVRLAADR